MPDALERIKFVTCGPTVIPFWYLSTTLRIVNRKLYLCLQLEEIFNVSGDFKPWLPSIKIKYYVTYSATFLKRGNV